MDNKLPKNWINSTLHKCLLPVKTGVDNYSSIKSYYSTGSIKDDKVEAEGRYSFEKKPSRANRSVKLNDILQARMAETDKAFIITEEYEKSLFSTGFMQFRVYEETINPRFIFFYLKSYQFNFQKNNLSTGATQVSINDKNAKEIKLPLPPRAEQDRIVAKLDTLFGQLEQINKSLEYIPTLLKNFRQQVLTQAVTGKLTNCKVEIKELNDFLEDVKYGTSKKSLYETEGIPIFRIPNIEDGEINDQDLKFSALDDKEFDKLKLKEGDVLIIRSNGSISIVGRSAIVRKKHANYSYAGYLIRLRPKNTLNSEFLNYSLQSNYLRKQIVDKARSTSGVNNINSTEIKELEILMPLKSTDQLEIVKNIKLLFAKADAIEAHYEALKNKIEHLPQAILHKAFKGELVPQLESDGDARELLREIEGVKNELKLKK